MSKKRKQNPSRKSSARKASVQNSQHKTATKKPFHWQRWLKKGLIGSAFLVLIGATITVYSNMKQVEYDLSVVGNGTATVVQIHDPNCQLCRRLKNNLDSVKGDFKNNIQFKTANIANAKGRGFANKYNVPHVTLLFFNKKGDRVNTLQGVTPKEDIRKALEQLSRSRS